MVLRNTKRLQRTVDRWLCKYDHDLFACLCGLQTRIETMSIMNSQWPYESFSEAVADFILSPWRPFGGLYNEWLFVKFILLVSIISDTDNRSTVEGSGTERRRETFAMCYVGCLRDAGVSPATLQALVTYIQGRPEFQQFLFFYAFVESSPHTDALFARLFASDDHTMLF